MGEMCVTYGTETKKGAVENPEEQILLEDVRQDDITYFEGIRGFVVGLRRGDSI